MKKTPSSGTRRGSLLLVLTQFQLKSHCHSSEFSGAASSMSDIVTSANGLVAREGDTAF